MRKKILIKLGGASLQNPATLNELIKLIKGFHQKYYDVMLVHGGGPAINQELIAKGIQWKFINGQRQTSLEMMSVIEEVLVHRINPMLVKMLCAAEVAAFGVSGVQNKILFCTQADKELMQVGKIESVNSDCIEDFFSLDVQQVPILAPIGVGLNNNKYNINADWAAAKIAIALKAEMLIFLTDQDGILDQEKNLVHKVTREAVNKLIENGVISGGMYTKVMAMMAALNSGIRQIHVVNASAASLLLTEQHIGTLLMEEKIENIRDTALWN